MIQERLDVEEVTDVNVVVTETIENSIVAVILGHNLEHIIFLGS